MLKEQKVLPLIDVNVELPAKEGYYTVLFSDGSLDKMLFLPKDGLLRSKFAQRHDQITHWLKKEPGAESAFVLSREAFLRAAAEFYTIGRQNATTAQSELHEATFESILEYLQP